MPNVFIQSVAVKIILSRKSMDAECGGLPSPVLDGSDGRQFFPLPIPYLHSQLHYAGVHLFEAFTAWDFIKDVAPDYNQYPTCHLDPDLRYTYLQGRPAGWQPAFGQVAQAQTHLQNNGIGPGDLFLFFGWFQFATLQHGKFCYQKSARYPSGFHAIYGYLQVDKVYKPNTEQVPAWLQAHPHVQQKKQGAFKTLNNTIYTASKQCSVLPAHLAMPGAGCFRFDEKLILSKEGRQRTLWRLPRALHPDNGISLSYHSGKSWTHNGSEVVLRSASQGQEFIFTEDRKGAAQAWALGLLKSCALITAAIP